MRLLFHELILIKRCAWTFPADVPCLSFNGAQQWIDFNYSDGPNFCLGQRLSDFAEITLLS